MKSKVVLLSYFLLCAGYCNADPPQKPRVDPLRWYGYADWRERVSFHQLELPEPPSVHTGLRGSLNSQSSDVDRYVWVFRTALDGELSGEISAAVNRWKTKSKPAPGDDYVIFVGSQLFHEQMLKLDPSVSGFMTMILEDKKPEELHSALSACLFAAAEGSHGTLGRARQVLKSYLSTHSENKYVWNYYAELLSAGAPEYDYKMHHLASPNEFAWDEEVRVRTWMFKRWPDYNFNLYGLGLVLCNLGHTDAAQAYITQLINRKMDPRLQPFARAIARRARVPLQGSLIGP